MSQIRRALRMTFIRGLCVTGAACAFWTATDAKAVAESRAADRQLLVMLRVAPPHFRPDTVYGAGYAARPDTNGLRRTAEILAARYGLVVAESWSMPALDVDCFVMEAANHEAVEPALEHLHREPRVELAQAMNVFHVLGHDDPLYPLQRSALGWDLANVHQVARGKNVRVAEIDSGVEVDHPDLRGRVAMTRNFATSASTGEAHGTAIAGIIAARADDGIGIVGIAPDAELYALRACEEPVDQQSATCTTFTLAKALQFALQRDVQIINLSLGGPRDPLLERLLDVALARGITIVSAIDPRAAGGGFPAAHSGVLAVAAENSDNVPVGTLFAPGRDIPSTTVGHGWGFFTGSSYAAANVTGVVALLLEREPGMKRTQLRYALTGDRENEGARGFSANVDACSAIARVTTACICGCTASQRNSPIMPH